LTPAHSIFPALLRDAAILDEAIRHLDAPEAAADWSRLDLQPIYEASLTYAEMARRLAHETKRLDPDTAWAAGLLAPLGWLAMASAAPDAAAECLADPAFKDNPADTQRRRWGHDQAGIARRLARYWRLPAWLATIVGHLALPEETAKNLGADLELFRTLQLAVLFAQEKTPLLALPVNARVADLAGALGLSGIDLDSIAAAPLPCPEPRDWTPPSRRPLLRDLLQIAADHRRLAEAPVLDRLEIEADRLHEALEEQRASESERLRAQKLGTLAEFAAGAGHEINNPLAVISGQAQYLMGYETEPARQRALQTIVGQTQRIHDILTNLMQFARPARPQKRLFDVGTLMREVTVSLADMAAQRQIKLVCAEPEQPISLHADPRQIRTALTCLLRNAIEAAPNEGWAGIRVLLPALDRLEFAIEDSGPGLTASQREHMYDPFYSGRQAGRGRGLGLPAAWRLAREHNGDVYLDEKNTSPTRFILSLPRGAALNGVSTNGHVTACEPLTA